MKRGVRAGVYLINLKSFLSSSLCCRRIFIDRFLLCVRLFPNDMIQYLIRRRRRDNDIWSFDQCCPVQLTTRERFSRTVNVFPVFVVWFEDVLCSWLSFRSTVYPPSEYKQFPFSAVYLIVPLAVTRDVFMFFFFFFFIFKVLRVKLWVMPIVNTVFWSKCLVVHCRYLKRTRC